MIISSCTTKHKVVQTIAQSLMHRHFATIAVARGFYQNVKKRSLSTVQCKMCISG